MPGKVIGTTFNNGFPGHYAEQPDMLIKTFPNAGDKTIPFGAPVFSVAGGVAAAGTAGLAPTAALFKGIAAAQVKSALSYPDQSVGEYTTEQAMPVFERGAVSVYVSNAVVNAPAIDENVYVRISAGTPTTPVGGIEAEADGTNTIQITNAVFGSAADVNGVAEIVLKTRNNA